MVLFHANYGAVSSSYNYEEDIDKKVMTQVENELKAGKKHFNHLILRGNDRNRYNLKFNIPLIIKEGAGFVALPYCACLLWSMNTLLPKIGMVGDESTTGAIHSKAVDYINNFRQKHGLEAKVNLFAHEGEPNEWSMTNTIKKIINLLELKKGDKTILVPGDTPYVDITHLACDPDIQGLDALLRLNTKNITGQYYPRNYHLATKYYNLWDLIKYPFSKGLDKEAEMLKPQPSKEPNPWMFDLVSIAESEFSLSLFDLWHGARKTYDGKNKQMEALKKMIFHRMNQNTGEFEFSLSKSLGIVSMILANPLMMCETASYLRRKKKGLPENESKLIGINVNFARRVLKCATGLDVMFKPSLDPGGVMDFDSYEDTIFNQAMIQLMQDKNIPLNTIWPYYDDVIKMGLEIGKWNVELSDNWPEVANDAFNKFGINARFDKAGRLEQKIFSNERLEGQIKLMQDYWKGKINEKKNR